ncbi:MAG: glycosyltransferase family 39 protein [Chloroflexi bacterium]|nr:glycosyltransferase family 39 protein [Chloroflexota bacterium]
MATTAILLLAFGLRVYTAATQELRADEAFSTLFSRQPLAEIVAQLIEVGETHSPFHFLSLHAWTELLGESEFGLRTLSIFLGTLLLALLYQLGRRSGGRATGLLLMLVAAVSPLLIWISQDVRNLYTWAPLLGLLAALLLADIGAGRRPARLLWWGLYALLAAATVYSHYYGVVALAGHGLYLLAKPGRRRLVWPWLASVLAAALLFAPWPLTLWSQWLAAGHLASPDSPDLAQHLTRLGRELVVGSSYEHPMTRWLFLVALGLVAAGAYHLQRRRPGWAGILVAWLAAGAFGLYLVRFHRSTFNPFYIVLAAPAWYALLAIGLGRLGGGRAWWLRLAGLAALAGLLVASLLSLANYYFNPTYNRTLGYRPIAEEVAALLEPGDVFLANAPDPSLTYYLEGVTIPTAIWPSHWGESAEETEDGLAALAARYDRIWFVPATGSGWDEEGVALGWLNDHMLLEQATTYEKLSLLVFRPLHAVDQVLRPLGTPLDGLLELEGVYLTVNGQPAPAGPLLLAPGDTLQVTLLWQALAGMPDDYTVFVHVLAEDGRLVAQHDGVPVHGTRHTSTWQPGERLLDRHEITIPAGVSAGGGRLVVGMYEMQTLERQQFANGQDVVTITPLAIRPE